MAQLLNKISSTNSLTVGDSLKILTHLNNSDEDDHIGKFVFHQFISK